MNNAPSTMDKQIHKITTRKLSGFDDPGFTRDQWMRLLSGGQTNTVNLTWDWQKSWWGSFGKGRLLLMLAEKDNVPIALAPLFEDRNMIYNICPEDCLDFIGDVSDTLVMDALLSAAIKSVPNCLGINFYFIPDKSTTGKHLQEGAARLNLDCCRESSFPSPYLSIVGQEDQAMEMTRKKSLRRHENYFRREGLLEIFHYTQSSDILPHLNDFFQQHIKRRDVTEAPSLFIDPRQQEYYRKLTVDIGPTGWLRFTRITWNNRPIAFHYGLSYNSRYLYGIPSFDIDLAAHSPGEVLLRHVLIAAIEEGADTFDFGIGDEAYKYRFATGVTNLITWGLNPRSNNNG